MTALLGLAPPETTTATALPVGAPAGTVKLIWLRPTQQPDCPANTTVAGTPPRDTTGFAAARAQAEGVRSLEVKAPGSSGSPPT